MGLGSNVLEEVFVNYAIVTSLYDDSEVITYTHLKLNAIHKHIHLANDSVPTKLVEYPHYDIIGDTATL